MASLPILFEPKDAIGLALFLAATGLLAALLLAAPRLRVGVLFLMAAGAVLTEKLDLNIFSAYWYRGTTRGFEVTFIDALAGALLLATFLRPRPGQPRGFWPASLAPLLVFLLWAAVSVALAEPRIFGLYEYTKLARGFCLFLAAAWAIRDRRDLSAVVLGLACAALLQTVTALRQRYGMGVHRVTGTLDHPNSVSMYLCLVTPVLVAAAAWTPAPWLRRLCWLAVAGALLTVLLTVSRAGIPVFALVVGAAAARCLSWRPTPGRLVTAAVVAVGLAIVVGRSWDQLVARYQQASLSEEYLDASKEGRGYYFRQAAVILADRPFGVGLNNWSYWVSKEYAAPLGMHYENYDDIDFPPPNDLLPMYRYAAPAHNLGALTAGELGWGGLALFALVWLRWLQVGAGFYLQTAAFPDWRLGVGIGCGLLGVFLQSLTEWTFRQTQIFLTIHLLLGLLAGLHHRRRSPAPPATSGPHERPMPAPPVPELAQV